MELVVARIPEKVFISLMSAEAPENVDVAIIPESVRSADLIVESDPESAF